LTPIATNATAKACAPRPRLDRHCLIRSEKAFLNSGKHPVVMIAHSQMRFFRLIQSSADARGRRSLFAFL
jgi:hypothetical protein